MKPFSLYMLFTFLLVFTILPHPLQAKGRIYLLPVGEVDTLILERLLAPLEKRFGFPCALGSPMKEVFYAYNPHRDQYFSTAILGRIREEIPSDAVKVLGVVSVDLFVPRLNFVFGEALLGGRVAVISLCRLNPQYYRQKRDDRLYLERALKEAVHELGHTFGLEHCSDSRCVMFFSNSLLDTDRKSSNFCSACQVRLQAKIK